MAVDDNISELNLDDAKHTYDLDGQTEEGRQETELSVLEGGIKTTPSNQLLLLEEVKSKIQITPCKLFSEDNLTPSTPYPPSQATTPTHNTQLNIPSSPQFCTPPTEATKQLQGTPSTSTVNDINDSIEAENIKIAYVLTEHTEQVEEAILKSTDGNNNCTKANDVSISHQTPQPLVNKSLQPLVNNRDGIPASADDEKSVQEKSATSTDDPELKHKVDDSDMRYLFKTIGDLLENTKATKELTEQIPTLITTVNSFRNEIKGDISAIKEDISDLSGRMLELEEDMKKMKSFNYTTDGRSIVMSNKSRINNVQERNISLEHSISSLKNELENTKEQFDEQIDNVKLLVATTYQQNDDPDKTMPWAAGWDEDRVARLEHEMKILETRLTERSTVKPPPTNQNQKQQQLQQQQQQQIQHQAKQHQKPPPKPKKQRQPRTYIDRTVRSDALMLTDSNGRSIAPSMIEHNGGVERHTCYTTADMLTFAREVKVTKIPSKIFIQVGTSDLTLHRNASKLL